ncbi:MAG: c-type cytochrome biogenesis protein CcmF, partial [Lysobacterales bacterium CG02_land_8_20_14_3_00_62_12]
MTPEIGQFTLILALLMALLLGVVPMLGAARNDQRWMAVAPVAAGSLLALVAISFLILIHAFVQQDFSVAYVAANSNLKLPIQYRISAVWGAHEGSFLLWSLILSVWTALVAAFSRSLPA